MQKPSPKVEQIPTNAPMPFLRIGKPANGFRQLKKSLIEKAGFDFLAVCGDVMRPRNFHSTKIGVANRSRHMCGDAIDVNQSDTRIVVVSEPHGIQQFFRIWLKCEKQDGTLGVKVSLIDIHKAKFVGYYVDFTSEAERLGWQRIPAWRGWSLTGPNYNKMEWWHYQLTEGLSFDEAINFLYNPVMKNLQDARVSHPLRVLGLNDRGSAVRNIQEKLHRLKLLERYEIDGVFGKPTQTAVKLLQEKYGLDESGEINENTRGLIDKLL